MRNGVRSVEPFGLGSESIRFVRAGYPVAPRSVPSILGREGEIGIWFRSGEGAFLDRADAGRRLADTLRAQVGKDCVVYALPRGGVIVGGVIARALGAPLDIVGVRKIGHPSSLEYAIGAVAEAGPPLLNSTETASLDSSWLESAVLRESASARESRARFGARATMLSAEGRIAIVVDDGVATGYTLRAALHAVRAQRPERLVAAVPVGPPETVEVLRREADEVVVLKIPEHGFGAVGSYYEDFSPVSDEQVRAELHKRAHKG